PHASAPVAVNRRDIRPAHAVMLEPLVKRGHAGLANPVLDKFADAVLDHGGADAGFEAKAVTQVGRDIVLATRDVNVDAARLAKGKNARVKPVDDRAQGKK